MERTAPGWRALAALPRAVPEVPGRLRRHSIRLPEVICRVPGVHGLHRHVRAVLASGVLVVTSPPPMAADLFRAIMERYRADG